MPGYRERRTLIRRDVWVRSEEAAARAELRNATRNGLHIASLLHVDVDDEVFIESASWELLGNVVWKKSGEFGVRLKQDLSLEQFQHMTGKSVRLKRRSRVGFGN